MKKIGIVCGVAWRSIVTLSIVDATAHIEAACALASEDAAARGPS